MIDTNYGNMGSGYYRNLINNINRNNRFKQTADAKSKSETKKKSDNGEITKEDFQKLYAKLNGIDYDEYDDTNSFRSVANSFLNEMVFSSMGSSKELFTPQVSRGVLSAAFNAAYDISEQLDRIQNASNNGKEDGENFDVEE